MADEEKTRSSTSRRHRALRLLKAIVVTVGALFFSGVIFLIWAFKTGRAVEWVRNELVKSLHEDCGIQAKFSSLIVDPFPPGIAMTGLDLAHLDGRPILAVEEAIATFEVLPLFARRLQIDRIAVLAPRAVIELEGGRLLNLPRCLEPQREEKSPTLPIVLGIRELTIERGSFSLQVDDVLSARVDGIGVSLAPRKNASGSSVAIGVDEGLAITDEVDIPLHRFRFLGHVEGLLTAPRAVVVEHFDAIVARARLAGKGSIDLFGPFYEADLVLDAPLDAIHDFMSSFPRTEGDAHLEVSISGTPKDPKVELGRLFVKNGRVDVYELADEVTIDFRADRTGAEIPAFDFQLADGRVRGKARIEFDEHLTVKAETDAENISLGRTLDSLGLHHAWVDWRGAGKGTFIGTILDPMELKGVFDYVIRDFRVFDGPWDGVEPKARNPVDPAHVLLEPKTIGIRGKWAWDPRGISFVDTRIESGLTSGIADARLNFANADGLEVRSEFSSFDFEDLGPIAGIRFGGRGSLQGVLSGPYDAVGASGSVDLDGTTIEGIPFGRAKGAVSWHDDTWLEIRKISGKLSETTYSGDVTVNIAGEVPFSIVGQIGSGRVQDLLLPFGLRPEDWGDPSGRISGRFDLTGPIDRLTGPIDLSLDEASIVGERFARGRAEGRMETGAIVVEDLEVYKRDAAILASGRIHPKTGEIHAQARTRGLTLQDLDILKVTEPDLEGKLDLRVHLAGNLKGVTGTISAQLSEVFAGMLPLPGGSFVGRIRGANVAVRGDLLGKALHVEGDVDLVSRLPYRATLELAGFDVPKTLAALDGHQRWHGTASGRARLTGALVDWHLSGGEIAVEHLGFESESVTLETAVPALFTMRQGVLDTRRIVLVGPRTKLTAEGKLGKRILDLKVQGKIDLGIVEALSPSVERAGGVLVLDSSIEGVPGRMSLVGTGQIQGGIFQWRGFGDRLTRFGADLAFSQSTVLIERAEGAFADGRIAVSGNLALDDFRVKNMALAVALEDVKPKLTYPLVDLSGTLKGTLGVEGPPARFLVRGDIDVRRGKARPRRDLQSLVTQRKAVTPNVLDPSQEVMEMDIMFHAVDSLRVKNDTVDVELKGDLRLTGTNQRFGILGTANALRGGRVTVLNREYEMINGTFDFQERYQFAPRYDLVLETSACSAQITVSVVGTLESEDFRTSYSSNPEMDETDIVSCLIKGVRGQEQDDLAKFASGALWKVSGLDREVKKVLPIDDIDVTTEYSPQTRAYEPRVLVAKELTIFGGPARLEYSSSLLRNEDQRVALRYRITPRLTLQGGWVSTQESAQPVIGDLGLDLKYRWEW